MSTNERSSVVRLAFSAVALSLAIIANPALAQTADRPTVKVGDEWQFVEYYVAPIQKPNLIWVITAVTPAGITGTENGKPLTLTPDSNMVESARRKHSDLKMLSFPLEVGMSWAFSNDFMNKEAFAPGRSDVKVTVAGYEKVRVPAGDFDAFKIEAKGKMGIEGAAGAGAIDTLHIYWYAPTARAVIKQVYRDAKTGEKVTELVEFKLQP